MTRLAAIVLFALLLQAGLDAGNRAFREGRYADAERAYRAALDAGEETALLHYNLGAVLLRLERWDEAREQLRLAAEADAEAASPVRQAAHYNAGNAGLEPAFSDPALADRVGILRAAVAEYRAALLLDPTDEDAKWNLELAQRLLESLAGGGGGGGGDGGGGGGDGSDSDASAAPDEAANGGGGGAGETPAERVLREAAARDRELHEQRLQRSTRPPPGVRDW